jgi:PKD repeat protein
MLDKTIRTIVSAFLLGFLILLTSTASYSDVIIDNGGVGTSYTGSWSLSGGTDLYGASSLWSRNGATYTFSMNGQQAGTYEVLMWWSGWSTRATSVPVAINHAGGTQNITINQLQNAGQWNSLGTFYFNGSGSVTITAANDDTSSTCADAVQFRYIPGSQEVIIDNTSSDTSRTGTWTASSASGYYGTDSVWGRDGATFTWRFTPTQTGNYNVSMWWTTTSSRSSSIPVQINNANGSQTVTVNQLQNAGQWNSLGTFNFVAGVTYNMIMTSQPSPTSSCADAMKFTLVSSGPTAVIDSITPNPANLGQTVTFTGHGTGGTIAGYQWTSSIDGAIGSAASFSTSSLSAGTHSITFKVTDTNNATSEAATASLMVAGTAAQDIIIDNTDSRTSRTGTWTASSASGYYGTDSVWSRDGATFTWNFTPTNSGYYEVSLWWTTTSTRSPTVPVTIRYAGGTQVVTVNQLQNGGKWNSLGSYLFTGGTTYSVTVTSQPAPTSTCADAVKIAAGSVSAPVADFIADPVTGAAPLSVTFTDLSKGTITSWLWNFGDGSTSTNRNPSHTYSASGAYTVSLTATGPSGSNTAVKSQYINTTGSSVEHIYIGDGYAKDAVFVPNIKIILRDLKATDAGDTWYYTNRATGKSFAVHFVNTTSGFISALKQLNAHIIWNGHSNFGMGGVFASSEEVNLQQIDAIRYIDDDRFTHVSTPMASLKIDGMQYGQAYPNWLPKFKNGASGVMPYTFSEGTPPYNYYLTYKVPGDPTLYKIELSDGRNIDRFWDSGVPAWYSASGLAPDPAVNPEYFVVNNDPDYNRCDFTGNWPIQKEADDLAEYSGYNYQYHAAGTGANSAEWTVVVRQAANYQVTATWQSGVANASNAKYIIQHDGGTTSVEVDQRAKTGGYPLGVFPFSPGSYKIRLTDDANGRVIADSVRLSSIDGFSDRLQAEFASSVLSGSNPLTVRFSDRSEIYSAGGETISSWFWDFGDGATSTEQNPQHIYTRSGTFTVALTVTGSRGTQDTEVKAGVIRVSTTGALKALFTANTRNVTTRTSVQFTDMSSGTVKSWL